ncbi:MAG TPA: 30S ribosomal protein S7 [Candidatus Nanoarchaeia archaeon]|nr:30S ribosomal protein S7 [Candidatus Nanoarchaeia archaeon]
MAEIKAFNKWNVEGIQVQDPGLKDHLNINPRIVPRSSARFSKNKFHRGRTFVIERLMNKMMGPGHKAKKHKITSYPHTGKSLTAYRLTEETLESIEKQTKQNPIKVFVEAIENAAPREEIISIEYGGARYPKAVECSPQRRIDVAIRHMTQGAFGKSFNSKRKYVECLSEEIINAWQKSGASHAISKKLELERQADASR